MRIAIINITGGGMSGGYKKYLRNILPRLASHSDVEKILCCSPNNLNKEIGLPAISNIAYASCKAFSLFDFFTAYKDAELTKRLEDFEPDVIFIPVEHYFKFKDVPVVNILRNMEPFIKGVPGETTSGTLKQKFLYYKAKKTIKKSDKIIVPSNFVSDFLVKKWHIPKTKIKRVYYGIDRKKNNSVSKPLNIPEELTGDFIFTAGSIRPARGLMDLFLALKNLHEVKQQPLKLVIAGDTGGKKNSYHLKLKKWLSDNKLSDYVIWTGFLSDTDMTWCFQNCKIFVMTSRVESFGMIAAEAMLNACISISANSPCLPEIFGESAIFYPAKDSLNLAEKIADVLSWDSQKRLEFAKNTQIQVKKFSCDLCAEKTFEVLKELSLI